jgi:inhibitor of KinA
MGNIIPFTLYPLGDSAITIEFGNSANELINRHVMERFNQLKDLLSHEKTEIVPAYCSVTVFFDPLTIKKSTAGISIFDEVKKKIELCLQQEPGEKIKENRLVRIPVCYEDEFAPDLSFVLKTKNISANELISLHGGTRYRVYMLGFLPGFPYMGWVPDSLILPRKPQPVPVKAGSVGIAGKQTGVYSLDSPGGWQIIGKTPLQLFNAAGEPPVLLCPGDEVEFYSINKEEYYHHQEALHENH